MIPLLKLKTIPVTTSHPPQSRNAARARSVRGARQRITTPTTSRSSAAGRSHEISPPNWVLNKRLQPVGPHRLPVPPPPPTLPDSLPVSRPKPLYPNIRLSSVLFCEPPMYGRSAAGTSTTAATHQPAETASAAPPIASCTSRRRNGVGAATR